MFQQKTVLRAGLRQLSENSYGGLFPKPFNTALRATIQANATCGAEDEEFCQMADLYSPRWALIYRQSNKLSTFTTVDFLLLLPFGV